MAEFIVGKTRFTSKAACKAFVKDILDEGRQKLGKKLPDSDCEFLRNLISEHHPQGEKKLGAGIDYFYVDQAGGRYPSTCFWFFRRGETKPVEFSYHECFKRTTDHQRFHAACREAIADDIEKSKKRFFEKHVKVCCEITGEELAYGDAHVDHKAPFSFYVIVEAFIAVTKIKIEDVEVKHTEDRQFEEKFASPAHANMFRSFHRNWVNHFGSLRILCKKEHQKLSSPKHNRYVSCDRPLTLRAVN